MGVLKKQPFVSLVVLFYNQEDFVTETLDGVFSQTYENMEIIISDDASPDGTYTAVERYLAEHACSKQIFVNQNKKNMGLVPHLNYLIENYVHGDIIALAGGDDISMPNRISDTVAAFNIDKNIKAVTGQYVKIDKYSNKINEVTTINDGVYTLNDAYIRTFSFMCGSAGLAICKEVWDIFGALLPECPTEDSTLRFRSLLLGEVAVSPNVFIQYRIHGNNLSGQNNIFNLKTERISAQYKHDLLRAKDIGVVSTITAKRLERKIYLYSKERKIASAKYGKPRWLRAPYKFIQNILGKMITRI